MAASFVYRVVTAGAVAMLAVLPVRAADSADANWQAKAGKSMFSLADSSGAFDSAYVHVDFSRNDEGNFKIGMIRSLGATVGVDRSSRPDAGYSVGRRVLVAGPTVNWNVRGHLSTSLLLLNESSMRDAFGSQSPLEARHSQELYPMFSASWDIPVSRRWSFEGYANLISFRGRDEPGFDGGPEASVDVQLMYDAGAALGRKKDMFRIGIEYQYSSNKYGGAVYRMGLQGLRPRTPMLRADFQF